MFEFAIERDAVPHGQTQHQRSNQHRNRRHNERRIGFCAFAFSRDADVRVTSGLDQLLGCLQLNLG